jgi:hypothetical protein
LWHRMRGLETLIDIGLSLAGDTIIRTTCART